MTALNFGAKIGFIVSSDFLNLCRCSRAPNRLSNVFSISITWRHDNANSYPADYPLGLRQFNHPSLKLEAISFRPRCSFGLVICTAFLDICPFHGRCQSLDLT